MGINSNGTTLIDQGVFQNIGAITWDTTAKTGNFTAVSGNGYFVNTTSASITVTLPASPSAGDVVGIADYANTADTNKISIGRNGSNIQGVADDFDIVKEGGSIVLVYVDATQGWLSIDAAEASAINNAAFIVATGGTITTDGNYKVHTFTGPGTFTVSSVGNPAGSDSVDYVVTAGGAGGAFAGGGGGAGGFREGYNPGSYTASPLATSALPVSATGYPITVGGGGAGGTAPSRQGVDGSNSVFSTITSAGGGYGENANNSPGGDGGSGGGAGGEGTSGSGGSGNTPPVSPPQGNNGGNAQTCGPASVGSSGGGGATVAGAQANPGCRPGGPGGDGATTGIPGSPTAYAGGGGGGAYAYPLPSGTGGCGGAGGGGKGGGNTQAPGFAGTTNTGGGGGGGTTGTGGNGAAGGSGIVIIRYKFQ